MLYEVITSRLKSKKITRKIGLDKVCIEREPGRIRVGEMKFLKNLITGLSLLFLIFSAGGMGTVLAEMGEDFVITSYSIHYTKLYEAGHLRPKRVGPVLGLFRGCPAGDDIVGVHLEQGAGQKPGRPGLPGPHSYNFV